MWGAFSGSGESLWAGGRDGWEWTERVFLLLVGIGAVKKDSDAGGGQGRPGVLFYLSGEGSEGGFGGTV